MDGVAITRLDDQNFKVFSCLQVATLKEGKVIFHENNIKQLLDPLFFEGCRQDFIDSMESTARNFAVERFKHKKPLSKMGFKGDNNVQYNFLSHQFSDVVFLFLVKPINDKELKEIEKNSTGKTYLAGDFSDMFVERKDFH